MHNYGEEKVSDLLVIRHTITTVSENVSQITLILVISLLTRCFWAMCVI